MLRNRLLPRTTIYLLVLLTHMPMAVSVFGDDLEHGSEFSPEAVNKFGCAAPEDLVEQLLNWIESHTEYDTSVSLNRPPTISFCESGENIPYEDGTVSVDHMLRGAYDLLNRTIFLVAPWNISSAYDQSVLLHELIHDVQHINRHWECIQQPEWEAYKLQDQWLTEHDIKSGFDWLQIFFIAKCPRDIHP